MWGRRVCLLIGGRRLRRCWRGVLCVGTLGVGWRRCRPGAWRGSWRRPPREGRGSRSWDSNSLASRSPANRRVRERRANGLDAAPARRLWGTGAMSWGGRRARVELVEEVGPGDHGSVSCTFSRRWRAWVSVLAPRVSLSGVAALSASLGVSGSRWRCGWPLGCCLPRARGMAGVGLSEGLSVISEEYQDV